MKVNEIMNKEGLHLRREFEDMRDLIENAAKLYDGKTAYSYRKSPRDEEAVKVTFNELCDDIRALSTEFISRGYEGKKIALIAKLSYPWVCTYFATLISGAVLVPLDKDWKGADLADTVKKAEASVLICDPDISEKESEIISANEGIESFSLLECEGRESVVSLMSLGRDKFKENSSLYFDHPIDPLKLALLVFTSGTTGKGKGVMLNQRAVLSDMADSIQYIDFSDKTVGVLPPHHTFGSSVMLTGHASIGSEIYISAGIKYVVNELKAEKPGHLVLVPLYLETFYRKILANIKSKGKEKLVARMMKISNGLRKVGIDLRKKLFAEIRAAFGGELKTVICGGAALNREIVDFFDGIGITTLNGYGITECAPIIAVNHSKKNRRGSVGPALLIDDVKIENPNEDGEGEIIVKGSNVMLGYYKDEEATSAAMDENGYFHTGDIGKLGKDGEIYITGRIKNLIILSNGKNVYPEEIENEFVSVPGVLDIIVYEGQSKRGLAYNTIVAEVYPDADYISKNGIEDVKAYLQPHVDNYNRNAVPYKKIGILKIRTEEFPKNTLRKILLFKLDMTID
jgi:long-chain acyl-CoA synthetase